MMTESNQTTPWLRRLCEFLQGYQLTQAKESAERLAAERQTQIESLTKTQDEQTQLAEERQARIEELTKSNATSEHEKTEIVKQRDELKQEVAALRQECDIQARLAAERGTQIEQLTQVKKE
jgi:DNA-binding transcriptional regulator YdaS (Cro superfamily)